jgi:hypothetical protein
MAFGDPQFDDGMGYGPPPFVDMASPYGDPSLLPAPPPPDAAQIAPPAPVPASPLDAAQYLPAPPPPDMGQPAEQPSGLPGPLPQTFEAPPPIGALPSAPPSAPPVPSPGAQPAPPLPDALSGVDTRKPLGELAPAYAPTSLTPEQHYQQTIAQYANDPYSIPDLAEQQRFLNDLALRDPIKANDLEMQHEYARKMAQSAAKAKTERENYDREIANLKARDEARAKIQKQTDEIMAESQRLAAEKIDSGGGLSGGQKAAGILSSIIGGFVQGRTGAARNAGLDAFTDTINRGIEVQKANMATRRGMLEFQRSALGEAYARTGDMLLAEEAVRQANYKYAINQIDTDAQNWDPRGTQAMARAKTRASLISAQAKSLQDFQYKQQEEHIKLREQQRKEAETAATIQHQKAQIGVQYAQIKEAQDARKEARRVKAQDKADEAAAKQAEIERKFAVGGAPKLATDAQGKPIMDATGKPIITYDRVRDAKGNPWTPPDDVHAEVVNKTASAHSLLNVYDRILALRDKVGGESGLFNSDEYQELKGLEKEALLLKKQGTQGMSSDKDMDNLVDAAGVGDVTSFRSRAAGIKAARARLISQLDNTYRAAGYDGPALKFDNPYTAATNTPEDEKLKSALRKPDLTFEDVLNKELSDRQIAAGKENGLDITNNPDDQALYREAYQSAQAKYHPGASPRQQEYINEQVAAARGDSPEAQAALTNLRTIADTAPTPKLRELARAGIESALRARGSDEQTTMSTRSLPPAPPAPGRTYAPPAVPDELRLR